MLRISYLQYIYALKDFRNIIIVLPKWPSSFPEWFLKKEYVSIKKIK